MTDIVQKWLGSRLHIFGQGKTPIILQNEASECGLACIAMVAGFFGKYTDLATIREKSALSSRGCNLASLITIAGKLSLSARPLAVDIEHLKEIKKPCILHWNFNHFVVLIDVRGSQYIIHDPALGKKKLSKKYLSECFTGVALELWPAVGFTQERIEKKIKIRKLLSGIVGFKTAITKIFCASLFIEFISLLMPVATQMVMDNAVPASDTGLLTLICTALLFMTILQAGVSLLRTWASMVMSTYIDIQWRDGLFNHLLSLPLAWFEKRKIGDIQSRFLSLDVLRSTFTRNITGAIIDGILSIGALILLTLYGGRLTWVVLGFTILYVILRVITWPRYRQASEELLVKNARAASSFTETLYAISTIRAQGLTQQRQHSWMGMIADATNSTVSLARFEMLFSVIGTFIGACDGVIILWLGISAVIEHNLTLGAFVAFNSFRGIFSDRILSLTALALELRMLSLHNERIADIALSETEEKKPEKKIFPSGKALALRCEGLSFRYDSQTPPVFEDLNFNIEPGESIAITGPSGSGKTTLMKVLCGLTPPSEGRVFVNSIDIQAIGLNNYRQSIACILQEDRLLSGSIKDNITGFSKDFDEDLMLQCAHLSHIHDDIMTFPMAYETLTGEFGEGLSGGQRQRLFIARALYRRPGILFMDEATSHLDEKNESLINTAIRQLNITRIIIAHRPSTIASAERIIKMR